MKFLKTPHLASFYKVSSITHHLTFLQFIMSTGKATIYLIFNFINIETIIRQLRSFCEIIYIKLLK